MYLTVHVDLFLVVGASTWCVHIVFSCMHGFPSSSCWMHGVRIPMLVFESPRSKDGAPTNDGAYGSICGTLLLSCPHVEVAHGQQVKATQDMFSGPDCIVVAGVALR